MASPFPFVAGSVLQAAQLNAISELPTRTLTASGAAVAADSYSRVVLNGTSITYTINTSTFSAGQVVELYNANSTAATIAAGAGVTLNGAAGFTLAQYQTGQVYAISATSFVLSKSDVTQTAAGMELVSATVIGSAVSSVTVSNAFSATYDNYKITLGGGASSAVNPALRLQLGSTTANYAMSVIYSSYNNTPLAAGSSGQSSFLYAGSGSQTTLSMNIDLFNPFLSELTFIYGIESSNSSGGAVGGYLNDTTSYTAFTVFPSSGTITSGTIRVYGYKN